MVPAGSGEDRQRATGDYTNAPFKMCMRKCGTRPHQHRVDQVWRVRPGNDARCAMVKCEERRYQLRERNRPRQPQEFETPDDSQNDRQAGCRQDYRRTLVVTTGQVTRVP
jgi:hypothetical protein